ncbi:MAG: DUF72 domain-containing protein [Pseudomonadota bacterium]|nr:DUF72 domain-containing protein [Pseudomonadota bacterium]
MAPDPAARVRRSATLARRGDIRIGISGWRYAGWRGVFYPPSLAQRRELEYASRAVSSIEINGSFYALQRPEGYAAWYRDTPEDFIFAVKGGRYITHMLKLRNVETALANFFASGVFNLREKLGPFLWQLPPNLGFHAEPFEAFLAMLPRDTEEALRIARRRDARMTGRCRLAIDAVRPLRHAVEIRHESFIDSSFMEILRRYNVALVVADTAKKWPQKEDVTADFVYLRLHGEEELYSSGYTDASLDGWASRIQAWSEGQQPPDARLIDPAASPAPAAFRDVYCYFDNDAKVHAPFDARRLAQKLGLTVSAEPVEPSSLAA